MDRKSAGISGQYTRSNNDYNRPDDHADSSRRVQYRHGTVEQWDNSLRTTPGSNEFYQSSTARSSQYLLQRSVNSAQDFNALIKREIMAGLVSKSDRFGHRYDGRNHGQYASSIKKYTSAAKRPLNQAEQSQLMRLLQNFTATRSWNWRSLTTTLHSFTSAGVFTPHRPLDERVKLTQTALLTTLLDAIIFKCNQKPEASYVGAQEIANMLWAMAKLVDSGQEQTPELNEAVATLLPHVNAQKANFKPQEIVNLLWAMAKLVDNGQEQTPVLNGAEAALLPHVSAQKANFTAQGIANLLWAMAKLVNNGQEQTPELKEAVAALLLLVNVQKANFKPQEIANLLWAVAKLVDNGQEQTPELKEAVAALLILVNAQKTNFKPQGITNLLWATAKMVDNGEERTTEFNEAVVGLLHQVNVQKANFTPQCIANLLWAMGKLLDNGQERTTEFNEAVVGLLHHVNPQKANFKPQEIVNLLWAMAKLVDSGQEQTPELNEAVAALLHHVNAQKDQFNSQGIANLLWAMAKLGELIELNVVTSTFESLVYRISDNPQLSQQDISISLWGVMVCCARLSLASNTNNINVLEKHMDDLFTRLKNTFPDNERDQSILAQAAVWLGRTYPVVPHYPTNISKTQINFRDQLQSCIPSLRIEEEKSLDSLPPVDLLLPDHKMVIEVQGPFHYVGSDFKTRKGSTLLKIALLQKSGFEVIEIPITMLLSQDLMKPYIDQIKTRTGIPPQEHGSVSLKRRWADAAYVTADNCRQPLDHGYLTAEEHSGEQTGKPGRKRKRKNSQ
ncbi:DUF1601 domain-containing protein [Thalassotalea sp. G20_0]|uniref:RAP domain-containing protein n=1 Tax=Thalassotalea sp. G20_0 TaxID=2821093 RepID=UPI001ADAF5BD|nr:RAP domain-containing protein [Thalassotalea sp. G20_0]MBO9496857.1 DUF1601 domain-containing protein [Thalassotalea sp. G20_0]